MRPSDECIITDDKLKFADAVGTVIIGATETAAAGAVDAGAFAAAAICFAFLGLAVIVCVFAFATVVATTQAAITTSDLSILISPSICFVLRKQLNIRLWFQSSEHCFTANPLIAASLSFDFHNCLQFLTRLCLNLAMYITESLQPGEYLLREGTLEPNIFILKSGKLSAQKKIGDQVKELGIINPGEFVGEMAYLSSKTAHNSDVVAIEVSEVIQIPSNDFYDFLSKNPLWMKALIRSLVAKVENLNKRLTETPAKT